MSPFLTYLPMLLLCVFALGLPHKPSPADECKRAGVFATTDVYWAGTSDYLRNCIGGAPDQCTQVRGDYSAIGPDQGYLCQFYKTKTCSNPPGSGLGVLNLTFPGASNLLDTPGGQGNWNDVILSYQCFVLEA